MTVSLIVTALRANSAVKLQNNELSPVALRQMSCAAGTTQTACTDDNALAYYNTTKGGRFVLALLSDLQEFRYMNSQGLLPPKNSIDAFKLNIKLLGVGGKPCISYTMTFS